MKTMNREIWKAVKGYEQSYEVSSHGRVRSVERIVERINGSKLPIRERILKAVINSDGYLQVVLSNNGKVKAKRIHQLVAESFLNHTACGMKLVVNHINFNRQDNRVENLEIVTNRENTNQKHLNSSSDYVGVYWEKLAKKWRARIVVNGQQKHLGYFTDEYKAHLAYQAALSQLTNPTQKSLSL
jgi:hypothetical protein